ncbi:helix-turn-helix domain-containing protein [Sporolactobacillus spathodeae]|uniref:Transcriptional regulator with XRE-family HTH domain n=1 Tax=Sporolactobacillus spathodeae TaxID=1465502 RepID=A0ABS2QBG9_9BACL|nr:helix-turn-helix transcriptional regulator [Sporolactobacillus spathodeae]MBM7659163.1 transcriptional regulator with XRE-family HTH domain [Sporolactobacillus spathodeae]
MENEQWGRKIRAFRKLKGYTQAQLARDLNISLSLLGEIERENKQPSEELLVKISTALHISVDEMRNI